MSAGKGDKRRPGSLRVYGENHDQIRWPSDKAKKQAKLKPETKPKK